jgi:predicted nucleic acid-binding Zn finger protein
VDTPRVDLRQLDFVMALLPWKRLLLCAMPLAVPVQALASTPVPPITSVAMEQGECFWGTCPHYVIAVNSDGSASYVGLKVAKKRGAVSLKLPAEAFDRIVRKIDEVNYFKLKRQYSSKADGCKVLFSDQSSVTFFVTRGQETTVVFLYYGCKIPKVADDLASLASLIDEVTGIEPLLGRDGG